MSDGRRSFWSSIPGLITGVAGLLTGVVGLITLLVQQGVVGNNNSSDKPPAGVTTTVAPGVTQTTMGAIQVVPTSVRFTLADQGPRQIKVTNRSSVPITIPTPAVQNNAISVNAGDCAKSLSPNLSCTITVTFKPSGALTNYTGKLVIAPSGPVLPEEVALSVSTL